jgi:hypothetical protein
MSDADTFSDANTFREELNAIIRKVANWEDISCSELEFLNDRYIFPLSEDEKKLLRDIAKTDRRLSINTNGVVTSTEIDLVFRINALDTPESSYQRGILDYFRQIIEEHVILP